MSIHQKDSLVTFTWSILPTGSPPVKADFDIALTLPDDNETYTDDGLTSYTAPTATTQGLATYNLTVTTLGRHQVSLTTGVADVHIVKAHREIFVVVPPTYVINGTPAKITMGPEVLPPPFPFANISNASYTGNSDTSLLTFGMRGFYLSDTGDKWFGTVITGHVNEHVMSTPYDLSTAGANTGQKAFLEGLDVTDSCFCGGGVPDLGKHIYLCSNQFDISGHNVWEHNGSVAWDIDFYISSSPTNVLDTRPTVANAQGIDWSQDGKKCYIVDGTTSKVYEWDAGTDYDLSTLVYNGVSFDFSAQGASNRTIRFNFLGTTFYMHSLTHVYEYGLTTAWDLSTASYLGLSFDASAQITDIDSMFMRPDETGFYLSDSDVTIFQYDM